MGLDIYFYRNKKREIGYFRKVNFLVAFFEKKGFDTPKQAPLEISLEDAEELLNLCEQVLEDHSKAKELLPTCEGFFFGDTDYDEYYFSDVEEVRDYLKNELIPHFQTLDENEYITFETWY